MPRKHPDNWEIPEIDEWEKSATREEEDDADERQFIGVGFVGFGGFGCFPRQQFFFCFPRQFCFPRPPSVGKLQRIIGSALSFEGTFH